MQFVRQNLNALNCYCPVFNFLSYELHQQIEVFVFRTALVDRSFFLSNCISRSKFLSFELHQQIEVFVFRTALVDRSFLFSFTVGTFPKFSHAAMVSFFFEHSNILSTWSKQNKTTHGVAWISGDLGGEVSQLTKFIDCF